MKFQQVARFEQTSDPPLDYLKHHHCEDVAKDEKGQTAWLNLLGKHVGPLGGVSVLDVGCGSGALLEACSKLGARPVGVDSSLSIHATRDSLSAMRGGIPFVRGDGCELPFVKGSFDVVVSIGVLEHVSRPRALVEEMARVLKPGGTLLLYFGPNRRLRFAQSASHRRTVLSYWTPQEAEQTMRSQGVTFIRKVWAEVIQSRFERGAFTFGVLGLYSSLVRLSVRSAQRLRLENAICLACRALERVSLQRNVGLIGTKC
ncbi:MAG: class I SAM-dependent methyltransferase [Chloroflexota bacterium]